MSAFNAWLLAHNYDQLLGMLLAVGLTVVMALFAGTLMLDAYFERIDAQVRADRLRRRARQ